jgi:hypothetical protein
MSDVKDAFKVWVESTKDLGIKTYTATADTVANIISPPKLSSDDKLLQVIMEARNCSKEDAQAVLDSIKSANTF